MQTPVRVKLEEFQAARKEWLRTRVVVWPETEVYTCVDCQTRIKMAPVKLEVHEAGLAACLSTGEEFETGIPYCPRCEPLPAARGCVHG
jgi:hypothetical protein